MNDGEKWEPTPGACEERVAEVGFEDGHEWEQIGYTRVVPTETKSVPLYCVRCGENGWRIISE